MSETPKNADVICEQPLKPEINCDIYHLLITAVAHLPLIMDGLMGRLSVCECLIPNQLLVNCNDFICQRGSLDALATLCWNLKKTMSSPDWFVELLTNVREKFTIEKAPK